MSDPEEQPQQPGAGGVDPAAQPAAGPPPQGGGPPPPQGNEGQAGPPPQGGGPAGPGGNGGNGGPPLKVFAGWVRTLLVGLFLLASGTALIYYLVDFLTQAPKPGNEELLWIAVCAGALGSWLHAISSFATYVGNRSFITSWTWWYVVRPFAGGALALIFLLLVRAGLLPSSGEADLRYSIAALGALAGLFAEKATKKLEEVFDTFFKTAEDSDSLPTAGKIRIVEVTPNQVTVGSSDTSIQIRGEGFRADSVLSVGGQKKEFSLEGPNTLKFVLSGAEMVQAGNIPLRLAAADSSGGADQSEIVVKAAGG